MKLEILLGIAGFLLLLCVFANKISDRYGIPSLLLFLAMGMLAGSDGIGGIQFQNARLANYIGTVALIFILYSGGLETKWSSIKPILLRGSILSTLGVFLTAAFLFIFSYYIVGLSMELSLLLSVMVSSTDAPAVFAILRHQKVQLQNDLKSILEFESGSNDPMAVFLSAAAITMLNTPDINLSQFIANFILQMSLGTAAGILFGRAGAYVLKKWSLPYQ